MHFTHWRSHFERNTHRPLPESPPRSTLPDDKRVALARSLAVFQRGESGEGRIAHDIDHAVLPGVDADYRAALKLFVAEEGRHARILGTLVRSLDSELLESTWTEALFRHGRRLMGIRLKLLVLMTAEVVGMTFYRALAEALGACTIASTLLHIVEDEEAHLRFHAAFFRLQTTSAFTRAVFAAVWWTVGLAAMTVVMLDHRRTLHAMHIAPRECARRFFAGLSEAHHRSLDSEARFSAWQQAVRALR